MSDGRIIIDTKLSNDGIKKDLQTVEKSVENTGKKITDSMNKAEKSVDKIGKTFKSVDFSKISKQLDNVGSSIEKTNAKIDTQKAKLDKLKIAYENAGSVKMKDNITAQMLKTSVTIDKLQSQLDKLNNKKITLESAKSSINGLDGNFRSASASITQSLDKVDKKAKEVNKSVADSIKNAGESVSKAGDKISSVGDKLSTKVTLPLVAAGVAAGKIGDDFGYQMSRVEAISDATGDEIKQLHDQALQLGKDTAFSANQAAEGMENLASAGFNTQEIMKAMPGMLDLAASSGEGLASSADIAASTLRGFGLAADQAGHVADVLAKNAGATNAAVSDTGEAMKYIAPASHAAGLGLEEVTAAIGIMANSGIKGSQAGTTLRSALTRLASPAKEAKDAMADIGFKAFDAYGKMLPLKNMIDNLTKSLKGKTDQQKQDYIATIFGQEAMSGMLTLIDAGSSQLEDLTQSYKNADGAAAKMAKTMQNNTKSSVEQMWGSIETAAIKVQEDFAPAITELANDIQNLSNEFADLSPEQQKFYLELLAGAAAAGPLLKLVGGLVGAFGALIKIGGGASKLFGFGAAAAETTAAAGSTAGLATAFTALTPAIVPVIAALGGLGVVIAGINTAQDQMKQGLLTTTDGMSEWQKAINGLTGYTFKSKKELQDLGLEYKEFGSNIGDDFKKKVEDATDSLHEFQMFLAKINLDGIIDNAESNDFNSQIEKMVNDAIATIDSKKAETQKKLSDLFTSDDGKIDEAEQKTLNAIIESYDKQKSEEEQLKSDVLKIKQDAVNRKQALNQQEIKDIEDKTKRIREIELDAAGDTQEEKDYAKNEFGARVESISATDAIKLLKEKKAALDEQNVQIKAQYDTQLDMLKRHLDEVSAEEKPAIQEEIDKYTKLRDDKTKLKQDEWGNYINILKQKNPEALALINEFNGEELTKGDKQAQEKLTQMKMTYEGLSNIVKSGTYELENVQTGSMENVTVTVDEGTGKIIGAYSETTYAVGGYTEQMAQDNAKLGQAHADLAAKAQQAMQDLGSAHINASGEIINASGQTVGALKDVQTASDGTVSGIFDLNGTPIKIEVNKDGTISNLQDILDQISKIPNEKYVTVRTSYIKYEDGTSEADGWKAIRDTDKAAQHYTGANIGSFEGFTTKDEHGWEMSTGENELYYVGGGTGILDHGSSVNAMKQDVANAVDSRFGTIISKLIQSTNVQSNILGKVANNTGQTVKLNENLAKNLVKSMSGANGTFSGLQSEIDAANTSKEKANKLKVDDYSYYSTPKNKLDELNSQIDDIQNLINSSNDDVIGSTDKNLKKISEVEKKQLEAQKHVLDSQKDSLEKEVNLAKEAAENEIETAKNNADAQVKIAEQKKDKLIKLSEAVTTALKAQLEIEKSAAEKIINDSLKTLEDKYNNSVSKVESKLKSKLSDIDEQIAALEQESTDTSREEERTTLENKISALTTKKANTSSLADQASIQKEIDNTNKELKSKEDAWDLEDEKAALEEEKALLQEKADAQKESLQKQYEARKEAKEEELKETDSYYDKLMETDSINAQARYLLLQGNSQDLVDLLNSYTPNWQDAGQSLADSLLTGLNSKKQSVMDAVNEIVALRNNSSSATSSSTTGYATGTNSNPIAGIYATGERGFELSTSGNVTYLSQGAGIMNHMDSLNYINSEIDKQVAKMRASFNYMQSQQLALMQQVASAVTNNNTTNTKSTTLHIENLNLNSQEDIRQLAYELGVIGEQDKLY